MLVWAFTELIGGIKTQKNPIEEFIIILHDTKSLWVNLGPYVVYLMRMKVLKCFKKNDKAYEITEMTTKIILEFNVIKNHHFISKMF